LCIQTHNAAANTARIAQFTRQPLPVFAYLKKLRARSIWQALYFQRSFDGKLSPMVWQIVAPNMQLERRANCSPSIDDNRFGQPAGSKRKAGHRQLS
jgi:hypothetical protein